MDSQGTAGAKVMDMKHSLLLGTLVSYCITVGILFVGMGTDFKNVLLGSLLPAAFAGPLIAMLMSLGGIMAKEKAGEDSDPVVRERRSH